MILLQFQKHILDLKDANCMLPGYEMVILSWEKKKPRRKQRILAIWSSPPHRQGNVSVLVSVGFRNRNKGIIKHRVQELDRIPWNQHSLSMQQWVIRENEVRLISKCEDRNEPMTVAISLSDDKTHNIRDFYQTISVQLEETLAAWVTRFWKCTY